MARITVIEDQTEIARLIKTSLETKGHTLSIYNDGLEGYQAVRDSPPDLALVDVDLPRMDGFEIVRRLREDDLLTNLGLVMLTAFGDVDSRVKGLQYVDDYIGKPFALVELIARVEAVLRRRAPASGVGGKLESVGGATTAMQIASFSEVPGVLVFDGGREIFFEDGKIVHIKHPSLEGEEALHDILRLKEGIFRFDTSRKITTRTLNQEPMAMLLEFARQSDEAAFKQLEVIDVDSEGVVVVPSIHVVTAFVEGVGYKGKLNVFEMADIRHEDTCLKFEGPNLALVVLHSSIQDIPEELMDRLNIRT